MSVISALEFHKTTSCDRCFVLVVCCAMKNLPLPAVPRLRGLLDTSLSREQIALFEALDPICDTEEPVLAVALDGAASSSSSSSSKMPPPIAIPLKPAAKAKSINAIRKEAREQKAQTFKTSMGTVHVVTKYMLDDDLMSDCSLLREVFKPLRKDFASRIQTSIPSGARQLHTYLKFQVLRSR